MRMMMNKLLNRIKFHKNNTSVAYSIVVDGKDDGFVISYDLGSWELQLICHYWELVMN